MNRLRYILGVLILVVTAMGGSWLAGILRDLDDRPGLALQIEFRDARGLRAGADVRHRGVTVGKVRSVSLAGDGERAVVRVLLDSSGGPLACLNSSFWVVTPRFGGLTGSTTGLETLVRDAYMAFHTPADRGTPLAAESLVVGRELPPQDLEPEALEEIGHGDLLMTMLVPENHGLRAGSIVVFRGVRTGEVRSVSLSAEGSHVEVSLRIGRKHRQTVTDKSLFWVAKPELSGALLSGFSVTDLTALLAPFVGYFGEAGKGIPVQDWHRVVATVGRPAMDVGGVSAVALRATVGQPTSMPDQDAGLSIVRVVYSAVERRTWGSDRSIDRSGSGLLYVDRSGRRVVAVPRSVVDGSHAKPGWLGGLPKVRDERISILLANGLVLRATRAWTDPQGVDLAALLVEGAPQSLAGTSVGLMHFDGEPEYGAAELRWAGPDGLPVPGGSMSMGTPGSDMLGAAVMVGGKVVGLLCRTGPGIEELSAMNLRLLPPDLRP